MFKEAKHIDCKYGNCLFSPLDMRPPKLVDIMESIVNFGKPESEKVKLSQLSNYARTTIFNFDYPLTTHITKEEFERMILNHFINRRIGFETVSLFRIQLEVKLNEIMPNYNKMFDFIENWDLFADGETINRTLNENKTGNKTRSSNSSSETTTEGESSSTSSGTDGKTTSNTSSSTNSTTTSSTSQATTDNRSSDTPQNQLQDVRDGKYVDKYGYVTNNATDSSQSSGTSSNTQSGTESGTTSNTESSENSQNVNSSQSASDNENTRDTGVITENITRTPANKIEIYTKFLQEKNNIYSLIFRDLEELFFQIL